MNLIAALQHHARMRPHDIAVVHNTGVVTFRQLVGAASAMATRMRSHGVEPGKAVAIYSLDAFMHMLIALGAGIIGAPSISAHPGFDPLPAEADVKVWFTEKDLAFKPQGTVAIVGPNWITDAMKDANTPVNIRNGFSNPTDVVRMYTSSGTTGMPKVVAFQYWQGAQAIPNNMSIDPYIKGPLLSMMWPSTIGGDGFANLALWHGSTLVIAFQPAQVLRAINLYKVGTVRASPQQLQAVVDMVRGQSVRFPTLERIELGGATIPPSLLTAARAMLCSNVMGVYGSTEAGLIAQAPAALLQSVPDAAGYVVPDVEIRIVDETGKDLGFDQEGIVHVRTPTMVQEYRGDAAATAKAFQDGWFLPGDLGVLRADGVLRITGRADEVINAGGVKLNPTIVDDFLMTQPGVVDAAAFAYRQPGLADQVWVAVVCGPDFNEEAVMAAARQKLHSRAPVRLLRVPQIPRNAMGKAMRQELSASASK